MNTTQTLRELVEQAVSRHSTSVRQLSFLAQKAGFRVVSTTLNQIRNGTYKSVPTDDTIKAIAWLAGVNEEVAFTAAGQTVPGPPLAEELPPGADNLSPKARKAILDTVRVFVDLEAENNDARKHARGTQQPNGSTDGTAGNDHGQGQKIVPEQSELDPEPEVVEAWQACIDSWQQTKDSRDVTYRGKVFQSEAEESGARALANALHGAYSHGGDELDNLEDPKAALYFAFCFREPPFHERGAAMINVVLGQVHSIIGDHVDVDADGYYIAGNSVPKVTDERMRTVGMEIFERQAAYIRANLGIATGADLAEQSLDQVNDQLGHRLDEARYQNMRKRLNRYLQGLLEDYRESLAAPPELHELAAHPNFKLARDKFDEAYGERGEESQDAGGSDD